MTKSTNTARLLCLLPATFPIISGILLLFFPAPAQKLFDFQNIADLEEPTTLAMGVRQLAIGLMIMVLAITKQIKALALVMMIGALVPLADYFIFSPIIGKVSALRHLATVPFIFGLGVYLLTKNNKEIGK